MNKSKEYIFCLFVAYILVNVNGSLNPLSDNHWEHTTCSTGRRQSPIDIVQSHTRHIKFDPFQFINYNTSFDVIVYNDGLKIMLTSEGKQAQPYITGGGLNGSYQFESLHFHWSSANKSGSEHHIQGLAFDGDMHMVHFKQEYSTIGEALKYPDGVAVLGTNLVFPQDNIGQGSSVPNAWLDEFADALEGSDLRQSGQIFSNNSFPKLALKHLILDRTKNDFFRYSGSLTSNPCSESVVWTVFRYAMTVPSKFFSQMRRSDTTVRPLQPLNGRIIYYSGDGSFENKGSFMSATISLLLLPLACAAYMHY